MIRSNLKNILIVLCFPLLLGASFISGGIKHDLATVASSSSTIVIQTNMPQVHRVTGTAAQVLKLPSAATLKVGYWYKVYNESTGLLTVSDSASTAIKTLTFGKSADFYVTQTATVGGWAVTGDSPLGFIGSITYAGTTSCNWINVNPAVFTSYAADTDCPTPTVAGAATATATKLPAMSFPVIFAGTYRVVLTGFVYLDPGVTTAGCSFRFTDGTRSSDGTVGGYTAALQQAGASTIVGIMTYATTVNSPTIQVQSGLSTGGSGNCNVAANATGIDFKLTMERIL